MKNESLNAQAEKVLHTVAKKYSFINNRAIKPWQAWLSIGLLLGIAGGVFYMANSNFQVEGGFAAWRRVDPAPVSAPVELPKEDSLETDDSGASGANIALRRYYSSSKKDTWATIETPAGFVFQRVLGYLLTSYAPDTVRLMDCFAPPTNDHFISFNTLCDDQTVVRTLGWIWSIPKPRAVPLYRCFDSVTKDYSVSTQTDCEGLGKNELTLGYIGQ
ncbi:MAG: hypothetical protein HYT37_01720 [Candidatus Sungbacteria bacterium]|nr:hypothetical protein [Candidatus Sungbacteria bacterium]